MHRTSDRGPMRLIQHAVGRMGAITALGVMPVIAYALGRLAWEQALTVTSSAQLMAGAGLTTVSLGQALSPLAAGLGALVAAHLAWTGIIMLVAPRRSRLRGRVARITPALWRRVVAIAATGAVSVGLAIPATAAVSPIAVDSTDAGWVAPPAAAVTEPASTPAGKATGEAPAGTTQPADQDGTRSDQPTSASSLSQQPEQANGVVVAAGDTLWDITASRLGLDRSDHAAIAAAWPELYHANRDIIGADPGLIAPDQRLTIPAEWTA